MVAGSTFSTTRRWCPNNITCQSNSAIPGLRLHEFIAAPMPLQAAQLPVDFPQRRIQLLVDGVQGAIQVSIFGAGGEHLPRLDKAIDGLGDVAVDADRVTRQQR